MNNKYRKKWITIQYSMAMSLNKVCLLALISKLTQTLFFFFFWESFNLWCPHLIIVFYHQTKKPINFWCRWRLNLRSLNIILYHFFVSKVILFSFISDRNNTNFSSCLVGALLFNWWKDRIKCPRSLKPTTAVRGIVTRAMLKN